MYSILHERNTYQGNVFEDEDVEGETSSSFLELVPNGHTKSFITVDQVVGVDAKLKQLQAHRIRPWLQNTEKLGYGDFDRWSAPSPPTHSLHYHERINLYGRHCNKSTGNRFTFFVQSRIEEQMLFRIQYRRSITARSRPDAFYGCRCVLR